jgi:hypothetical protein
MPSTSKKQHNFMAAIAKNPKFAKKVGVPASVGEEYMKADKGRKFREGGAMKHSDVAMDKKVVKKALGMHDKQLHGGKKTDLAKLKKGGMCKGYAEGGSIFQDLKDKVMGTKEQNEKAKKEMAVQDAKSPDTVQAKVNRMIDKVKPVEKKKGGMCKGYAAGGKVRGCGMATKGLTKGRMV